MPRLSVLLPVHNGQRTVRAAVASTLRAMPRDSELLVFDDASTDGTLEQLHRFADRRLSIRSSSEPTGVAGGLNRLLAVTDSAVVARMDADDVCLPWRFQHQLRALGSGRGSMDAVFTTVVDWHPPRGGITPHPPIGISPRAFPLHLTLANPVSHPTMLATRGVLEDVGGYRAVPAEDYDLWMRLAVAGFGLRRLAMPGLGYRIHGGQVTASELWRKSSWANRLVASVYRELTSRVLGTGFPRLNAIATSPDIDDDTFGRILEAFAASVRRSSAQLGRERPLVLRVLARRETEVRALRSRAMPGPR